MVVAAGDPVLAAEEMIVAVVADVAEEKAEASRTFGYVVSGKAAVLLCRAVLSDNALQLKRGCRMSATFCVSTGQRSILLASGF